MDGVHERYVDWRGEDLSHIVFKCTMRERETIRDRTDVSLGDVGPRAVDLERVEVTGPGLLKTGREIYTTHAEGRAELDDGGRPPL